MSKKNNVKKKPLINITKAPMDFGILILTLILVVFGIVMVFSASFYWSMAKFGSTFGYLFKDLAYASAGIILMLILSKID